MQRAARVVLVVALVVGAFFAGRWSQRADAPGALTAPAASSAAPTAPGRAVQPADASPSAPSPGRAAAAAGTRAPPRAGAIVLPADVDQVPVSSRARGPQPLLPEDGPRLAKAERHLRDEGGTGADLMALSRTEEQDADARRIEALIAQAIGQKGGNYDALRLDPPRCTRSVCILRGVGAGDTSNPRADWQRLSSILMNEPWFREVFDDMRGTVSGEAGNTVYVTLYVRCAPGQCRFGGR